MSRVLWLHDHDPYELFSWSLQREREPIERAYFSAWASSDECNRLMRDVQRTWFRTRHAFLSGSPFPRIDGMTLAENTDELTKRAQVEDLHCDRQAAIVAHFADDLLQTFGRGVLKRPVGYDGYGRTYNGGVQLTTMLRATTANARHLSEWEDLPFPYEEPEHYRKGHKRRQPLENIQILQRAFGVGKTERIRDVSSWRALTQMDGLYGTHPPDYQRVEDAILDAARDIALHASQEALGRLEHEMQHRRVNA